MLAIGNISCLLKTLLHGGEEVLVGVVRGASMLLAAVQMISIPVNDEMAAQASIIGVFPQVRDILRRFFRDSLLSSWSYYQ